MSQQYFTSVVLANAAAALNVKVGFQPGRIELINLTAVATPTDGEGWKAVWQTGMSAGYAVTTAYKNNGGDLLDLTTLATSNGITILNPVGAEQAQYGAVVSGFTNANPGVITVNSTLAAQITAGCTIRVSAVADDQSGTLSLNGDYVVASVTGTTIVTTTNTTVTGYSVYISGGFVTLLQTAAATTPNPPYNIFSNVPTWYNAAIQGFTIGTSCFANADNNDVILVAAYDLMSP